ncbi:putative RNA methyltransferase, TrmH family, group 3 [Marvinbryantia formatexigens DSM 14469]|uniref:RNA methyltransferase, TrmH family, group 3 n=1 Tax=Marvinbryantia formatexigens DSM 14469 TaxID=478749 RepID=C6LDR6_9FIRM|nr:RNA methyltransferase [Marvinbryantia formatexigens]EET61120.1 putative RNA methyltransferase, TrmH family, group 3 [Marvinbryantia formatexigens DSM 14469]UWO23699.1 RNA methyltransferase [Marvinbryantia formatexigens DSM 14469]
MINSTSNKQIKNLVQLLTKAKARREQGLFVAEGVRMYRETPKDDLVKTYVSESFYEKEENRALLQGTELEIVTDRVFASTSDTKTPQGILCLVRQREYTPAQMLRAENPLLLLLEDIQDPGNLGTIFRAAEAAGATGIIMSSGTADIYNPKTIRSTMGSIYRMPFLYTKDIAAMQEKLKARGIRTYAAHLKGSCTYTEQAYRKGCAFLIGNEGRGLSDALAEKADARIKIPMSGEVESLNAAVSAAILMFEAKRQRSGGL